MITAKKRAPTKYRKRRMDSTIDGMRWQLIAPNGRNLAQARSELSIDLILHAFFEDDRLRSAK